MGPQQKHDGEHKSHEFVTITVDGKQVQMHRGHQSVAAIKSAGGVVQGYALAQIVDGRDVPLADDGYVVLHGDEIFESYAPDGSSS